MEKKSITAGEKLVEGITKIITNCIAQEVESILLKRLKK
ncbi:hypothetical protein AAIR98_001475 [Elusimicrobium simillimum]